MGGFLKRLFLLHEENKSISQLNPWIVYNTIHAEDWYLLKYGKLEKPSLQLSPGCLAAPKVQDSTPFTISLWSVTN